MQIEAGYYSTTGRSRQRHRKKSIYGITIGVLLVMAAAIAGYYTFPNDSYQSGAIVLLMLPGLAIALWGCTHLARHRGYPSFAAFLLFLCGMIIIVIIPSVRTPFTFGFVVVFALLFPTVVIMALPAKKDNRSARRRAPKLDRY